MKIDQFNSTGDSRRRSPRRSSLDRWPIGPELLWFILSFTGSLFPGSALPKYDSPMRNSRRTRDPGASNSDRYVGFPYKGESHD